MANKEKRAKRAKLKAKQNRVSKSRVAVEPQFNSDFESLELKTLTSEVVSNEVPSFDSEIADYLEQFSFDDYAGNEMEVAIKNESAEVYRTIKTYGMKPFMDLIFYLQEIGLRDLYQDVATNSSGYDAVFVLDYEVDLNDLDSLDDLSPEQYQVVFNDYTKTPQHERERFLKKTSEKLGLSFDPEVILEILIAEFKAISTVEPELIAVANSSTLKWYQIANTIRESGFPYYHALMMPLIKECEYETGVEPKSNIQIANIPEHLLRPLTAWVEYMDGCPPIDNNEDFSALVKNKPDWTFNMCAVYWKFAYELTSSAFSENPTDNVKRIIQNATEKAFQNSSYLNL
ncbi:hypothetical protein [Moritella viscosa]|uniref:hypothetical protein n=1 Tax=Moritella viscosa TaxID=80854 RepID=UPI000920035C|nr:hypothetical protein [Moritella viscosa]SGZ09396.1 Uncharacterized protein NVI5482_4391 [Moritella viscosa]